MAAENARRAQLLGMSEMLRQHALSLVPDCNAAYLLVHRVLTAAFSAPRSGPCDAVALSLRDDIDQLAARRAEEGLHRVAA